MARFVSTDGSKVKLSEVGIHSIGAKLPDVICEAGFKGVVKDVLVNFAANLTEVYHNLLLPDSTLTQEQYEIKARFLFGYPFTIIFGTKAVTPSIKQIVVYMPYYINKAAEDGKLIGVPISIRNFSDGLMETIHKRAKQGNFVYSGGRGGAIGRQEYQKQVLEQIFYNETSTLLEITSVTKNQSVDLTPKKVKFEVISPIFKMQTGLLQLPHTLPLTPNMIIEK